MNITTTGGTYHLVIKTKAIKVNDYFIFNSKFTNIFLYFDNYQETLRRTGDEWNSLRKHQIPKPRNNPLINVRSAFGGLAIYHTEKLKGCWYRSFEGNKEVCEHVPFHEQFIQKGADIFINPNFINM